MYSEHVGDIFDTTADFIGHGVNCRGVMGAGIAKVVREEMPESYYKGYRMLCEDYHPSMLIGRASVFRGTYVDTYNIADLFTQIDPGPNASLEAIAVAVRHFFEEVATYKSVPPSLAIPRLGCGIGGLSWEDVREILIPFGDKHNIEVWELPHIAADLKGFGS